MPETTGTCTLARRTRRFRAGHESGDIFADDEDFNGLTVTIEAHSQRDLEDLVAALTPPDHTDLIRALTYALDASLDHLDREATKERRSEAGKAIRAVTAQRRAEAARKAVAEGYRVLGMPDEAAQVERTPARAERILKRHGETG